MDFFAMALDFLDLAAEASFLDAVDARGFATDFFLAGPLAAGLAAALPLAGFLELALPAPFPLPFEAATFFPLF